MVTSFFSRIKKKLFGFAKSEKEPLPPPPARQVPRAEPSPPPAMEKPFDEVRAIKKRSGKRRKRKKTGENMGGSLPSKVMDAHKEWDISQFDVPIADGKTRFHDLDLPGEILHAVADLGFQYCSPIQAEILPPLLQGRDASGQAQTGTGKTAAFLITMLTHFIRTPRSDDQGGAPRAVILAPTRELVIQITEEAELLAKYYPTRIVSVFGGMDYQKQRRHLTENAVDIIVATPGRLIDYFEHGDVRLDKLEILVIDEADRMLDMGFIPQVRRIVRGAPHKDKRQTLFFSATMVGDVERLASQWTTNPVVVEIAPEQIEVDSVEQIVYLVTSQEKKALLYNTIARQDLKRVIVFCNRRTETHRIADILNRYQISCAVISGEIAQKKRLSTLERFRAGDTRVLVATDVAGRGIHIEGVSHVINYTLPHDPENYVHRIGRTGRAGATGISVSFADEDDSFYIPAIEGFLGHELHCTQPDPEWLKLPPELDGTPQRSSQKQKRRPRQRTKPRQSQGDRKT
jgi:ATP-dependent RNA helicase RhlB